MLFHRRRFLVSLMILSIALLSTWLSNSWSQLAPPLKSSGLETQTNIGENGFGDLTTTTGVLHPQHARQRVIGYYQSWTPDHLCHAIEPHDLPVSELTHLNYAFASIDPSTYEIVAVDPTTSVDRFQQFINTKLLNPRLKLFISVGGWSFSDNGTGTQQLFSDIASSPSNRQKFADGVSRFMYAYDFDGLDLDWKYPCVLDRGERLEETQNFVSLLQTLRSTFDTYYERFGLTVTIPSSYWYLRCFDLPGIAQYVDWMNLMSYDLHGVWDRNNPLGKFVQAHTNLTEIKKSVGLLWRAGVTPSQISLGFGFYGRSFELSDPTCATPGCPFRGVGAAGLCTSATGTLAYYEIQAILAQADVLQLVHDTDAAVKYLVFGENQWISYDDADTFRQKLEWANAIGIGGSMIWAVDMDDDNYTATGAFFGQKVAHPQLPSTPWSITPETMAQNLIGQNGQGCRVMGQCLSWLDLREASCPRGYAAIGYDRSNCKKDTGRLICCPARTAPQKCMWRGNSPLCNGQCHPGEATVLMSSWGGGFDAEDDDKRCNTGAKVFCCEAGDWKYLTQDCYWTKCGEDCPSNKKELTLTQSDCNRTEKGQTKKHCCPASSPLYDCQWRGTIPQCDDNRCLHDEVAIANDAFGDSPRGCSVFKKRTSCCKISRPHIPQLSCGEIGFCNLEPSYCQDASIFDDDDQSHERRDGLYANESLAASLVDTGHDTHYHELEIRGGSRSYPLHLPHYKELIRSRPYPNAQANLENLRRGLLGLARNWVQMRSPVCGRPLTGETPLDLQVPLNGSVAHVEHPLPLEMVSAYWSSRTVGRLFRGVPRRRAQPLPDGPLSRYPIVPESFVQNWILKKVLPVNLPPIGPDSPHLKKAAIQEPIQWLFERLGSNTNPVNFIMVDARINAVKGLLESFKRPMANKVFDEYLMGALNEGGKFNHSRSKTVEDTEEEELSIHECISAFLSGMHETISMFEYLNLEIAVTRLDNTVDGVWHDLGMMEERSGQGHLQAPWPEFYMHWSREVSTFARSWLINRIKHVREQMSIHADNGYFQTIEYELLKIQDAIPKCRYPFEEHDPNKAWQSPQG